MTAAEVSADKPTLGQRLAAEGLGSFFLFAAVIGSGVMAESLAGGNVAVALLGNTLATGAMLFVLITMLGPVSGAHFNPAVSLVIAGRGEMPWREVAPYIAAQVSGGALGAWAAHLMFDLPVIQYSERIRTGLGQWLGESIATFGLILTILGTVRFRPARLPATAHWGIDDPAAVQGPGQREAFEQALHYMRNRIALFTALPIESLDAMSLQNRLRDIGETEGREGANG